MFENSGKKEYKQGTDLPAVIKKVTQQDINLYAEASGDYNPIHIDEAFAASTPLGGTIAHGMLILAYASEMMTKAFGRLWLEGGKLAIRFKAAARPGDTITASGRIDSIEEKEGLQYVNCSLDCSNQKGEVIITGGAVVRIR